MTESKRASIFDSDDDSIDLSSFKDDAPKLPPEVAKATAEKAAAASGFARSTTGQIPRRRRRPRSNRNVQFNTKLRAEDIEAIQDIADEQGWLICEVIEQALQSLKRELEPSPAPPAKE